MKNVSYKNVAQYFIRTYVDPSNEVYSLVVTTWVYKLRAQ